MNDKKKDGKRRRRCDVCNCLKYGVEKQIDPYTFEMHGREVEIVSCADCINIMIDEI